MFFCCPTCTIACRARRRNRRVDNISGSSPQQWPKTMSCENSRRKTLALGTTKIWKNQTTHNLSKPRAQEKSSHRFIGFHRVSIGQHEMQLIVLVAIHVSRIWSPFYLFSQKLCSHLSSTCQETLTLWWPIPSKEQSLPQSETPLRWNFPRLSSLDGLSVWGFEGLARQPSGIWRNCNPGFTEIRVPHLAVECGGFSENKPCNLVLLMFITKVPWWRFIGFAYQHQSRLLKPCANHPRPSSVLPSTSWLRRSWSLRSMEEAPKSAMWGRCVYFVLREVSRDSFWMLQIYPQRCKAQ